MRNVKNNAFKGNFRFSRFCTRDGLFYKACEGPIVSGGLFWSMPAMRVGKVCSKSEGRLAVFQFVALSFKNRTCYRIPGLRPFKRICRAFSRNDSPYGLVVHAAYGKRCMDVSIH